MNSPKARGTAPKGRLNRKCLGCAVGGELCYFSFWPSQKLISRFVFKSEFKRVKPGLWRSTFS